MWASLIEMASMNTSQLHKAALKEYEEELIESLKDVNLVSLARQAAERNLIPERVRTDMKYVHSSVPRPTKCRYLLYSVYEHTSIFKDPVDHQGMKQIQAGVENLLKVLSKWKATAGVLSFVRSWDKETQRGEKSMMLTEDHVSDLVESLAGCTSKWKEIATALHLPNNEIKNIVAMMHVYTPVMCLKEVLTLWVKRSYAKAKAPTLENLKEALCSQIVGLGAEGKQLGEDFLKRSVERLEKSGTTVKYEFNRVIQSSNLCVTEGSVALLEVQIQNPGNPVDFEWYQFEAAIEQTGNVVTSYNNGTSVAILCVHAKDLRAEGIYKCRIMNKTSRLASCTISLDISTPIDEHVLNLHDFYTAQPEVPEDTWPPVSANTWL